MNSSGRRDTLIALVRLIAFLGANHTTEHADADALGSVIAEVVERARRAAP